MAEQPPSGWQVRGSMPLSSFELPQSGHSVQRKTKAGDGRENTGGYILMCKIRVGIGI